MVIEVNGRVDYYYSSSEDQLYLVAVVDGRVEWVPVDFRPRFYVPARYVDEVVNIEQVKFVKETEYLTADTKEKVVEVQVRQPKDVPGIRQRLEGRGVKTYEADIPYVKVLMLNNVIRIDYDKENVAYLDIELWDKDGFPSQYGKTKIVCVGVMTDKSMSWFHMDDYESEVDMLMSLVGWLQENEVSVVAGWNVNFDYKHILHRLYEVGVPKKYINYWRMLYAIDLMEEYKSVVKGLSSYSLEEVSKFEGWVPKHREKMIWQMSYDELFEYNMYDVELLKKVEDKYGFIQVKLTLANVLNLNLDHLTPVQIWDMLIIKRLHELGYVAWNTPSPKKLGLKFEDLQYEGALVKEPEIGLWENVAYCDFTSLYPSIVINEKIEIEHFNGEVLPYLMKKYFDLRQEYKKKYKQTGDKYYDLLQGAVKIIINGGYGALAYCSLEKDTMFRFFKLENASFITAKGREIAKKTWEFVEKTFDVKVLYIDTDGLQIWLGDELTDEEASEFAQVLVETINDYIAPYQIKLEEVMKKVMYFGDYDKNEGRWVGIKKKYVAMDKNGEYLFRGLELRRGDASPFQKRILQEIIDMVFKEGRGAKEIAEYMRKVKRDLYKGKFDEELIIVKAVSKRVDEYKNLPPHIKALKKARMLGYDFPDGRVRFVWSKGFPEPVWEGRDIKKIPIDYGRYWDYVEASVRKIIIALLIEYLVGKKEMNDEIRKILAEFNIKVEKKSKFKSLMEYVGG